MSGERTERIQVQLRPADRATLRAAAELRKQSLPDFVAETLQCAAAGLRQAPDFHLTRADVFTRHPEPEAKKHEQDYTAERPWRWRRMTADSK